MRKISLIALPLLFAGAAAVLLWMPGSSLSFLPVSAGVDTVGSGAVLGAAERIINLPAATYDYFYPEYNLPQSEDKPSAPFLANGAASLPIFASSSAAIDAETGQPLYNHNCSDVRPIASITKLMTALVFLDVNPDWEAVYKLKREDVRNGGKSYIYVGDEVKVKDLWHLSLVGSDNTATVALVRSTGSSEADFVKKMNAKAKELGLPNTFFSDTVGLTDKNVSTAIEVAVFADKAFAKKSIREATLKNDYEFSTSGGRHVRVESTDYLLSAFPQNGIHIIGGKTGHTEEAGYCFVGEFSDKEGHQVVAAVLGAATNEARFAETKKLAHWVYGNFFWPVAK